MSSHTRVLALRHVLASVCFALVASAVSSGDRRLRQSASPNLAGTSWQLVKFQGSDDTTLTPDDRSKCTIAFGANGQLTARVDCNRGRGSWKSCRLESTPGRSAALTRAACPAGSMHDQMVKQWSFIRSYTVRDGHLFLALTADGGIYESSRSLVLGRSFPLFSTTTRPENGNAGQVILLPIDEIFVPFRARAGCLRWRQPTIAIRLIRSNYWSWTRHRIIAMTTISRSFHKGTPRDWGTTGRSRRPNQPSRSIGFLQ